MKGSSLWGMYSHRLQASPWIAIALQRPRVSSSLLPAAPSFYGQLELLPADGAHWVLLAQLVSGVGVGEWQLLLQHMWLMVCGDLIQLSISVLPPSQSGLGS